MSVILLTCLMGIILYAVFRTIPRDTTETFSNINPIVRQLLNNPDKTATFLKKILGNNTKLGEYDLRDKKNIENLKQNLYGNIKKDTFSIPLPKFTPDATVNNVKPPSKIKSTVRRKIETRKVSNNYCKFVSSNKSKFTCPKDFPVFTGAELSGKDITCGEYKSVFTRASAEATISNGKIIRVRLINKGSGYTKAPNIRVVGSGVNSKLKAIVKKGKIVQIKIISQGSKYSSTPEIVIDSPSGSTYCKMCCRNEL